MTINNGYLFSMTVNDSQTRSLMVNICGVSSTALELAVTLDFGLLRLDTTQKFVQSDVWTLD